MNPRRQLILIIEWKAKVIKCLNFFDLILSHCMHIKVLFPQHHTQTQHSQGDQIEMARKECLTVGGCCQIETNDQYIQITTFMSYLWHNTGNIERGKNIIFANKWKVDSIKYVFFGSVRSSKSHFVCQSYIILLNMSSSQDPSKYLLEIKRDLHSLVIY